LDLAGGCVELREYYWIAPSASFAANAFVAT